MQTDPARIAASLSPAQHEWIEWMNGVVACKLCGFVRRRDGKNKPCRGAVRVALRAIVAAEEGR